MALTWTRSPRPNKRSPAPSGVTPTSLSHPCRRAAEPPRSSDSGTSSFVLRRRTFSSCRAEFGSVDEVVERPVRSRLAGEDEIGAGVLHHLGDGMAGEADRRQETRGATARGVRRVLSNQRLTALRSQSCFSPPSWGAMNSGIRAARPWNGRAPRRSPTAWNDRLSVLPLARLRVRQCGQPIFCEQKNSVPSQAIKDDRRRA